MKNERPKREVDMERLVEKKYKRAKSNEEKKTDSPWFGLGAIGVVGWFIMIPTLAGTMLGIWLDRGNESSVSWTMTGMLGGLFVGCYLAWTWVSSQNRKI